MLDNNTGHGALRAFSARLQCLYLVRRAAPVGQTRGLEKRGRATVRRCGLAAEVDLELGADRVHATIHRRACNKHSTGTHVGN